MQQFEPIGPVRATVLVFIDYDSPDSEAVQPFHTGLDVPGCGEATPRGSLEARFFAFYD